jgi:3-hydroxyacyl-CoA dehydrogenase
MDAIGLDTIGAAGAHLIPRLATPVEPSLILHAMNRMGWKGRKSGRGFYAYPDAAGPPEPNERLASLVEQYSRLPAERLTPTAMVDRMLMVMLNQAADLLAERVVGDWADVDLALVQGIGFPESRGGLIFWAARRGLRGLVEEMNRWGTTGPDARRYRMGKALARLSQSPFRVIPGQYPSGN